MDSQDDLFKQGFLASQRPVPSFFFPAFVNHDLSLTKGGRVSVDLWRQYIQRIPVTVK